MLNKEQAYKIFLDKVHVGDLERCGQTSFALTYTSLGIENPVPLSLSFPKDFSVHRTSQIKNWLLGLFPEEAAHRQLYRQHMRMSDDAYLLTPEVYTNFLAHAHDLVGAVRFEKYGRVYEPNLFPVDDIPKLLLSLYSPFGKDASPATTSRYAIVPGGVPKVALYRGEDGRFYNPTGGAPSTHIIKLGARGLKLNAVNELMCLVLASLCGFKTSPTEVISTKSHYGPIWALITERFDRKREDGYISRIHAESLCQVLNVDPKRKYSVDTRTCAKVLDMADKLEFAKRLCFFYLIGAPDMHGSNWEILYRSDGSYYLSPIYDVWSMYPYMLQSALYRTAMHIGNEDRFFSLLQSDVYLLAEDLCIDKNILKENFIDISYKVLDEIDMVLEVLAGQNEALEVPVAELMQRMERPIKSACERLLEVLR